MFSAITLSACSGEIWRLSQANWRSLLATFWRISPESTPSTFASARSFASAASKSSGLAQIDSTGVEIASGWPFLSFTGPREAGISTTRP